MKTRILLFILISEISFAQINIDNKNFNKPIFEPFGIETKDLAAPEFVDIDGDGDLDIFGLKMKMGGGKIYFMENTGTTSTPAFSKPIDEPFGLDSKDFSTPLFVDIDGDGDLDIFGLKGKMGGGKIYFKENTGSKLKPEFSKAILEPFGLESKDLSTPKFVDIDNDGDLDVFGLKIKMGGGKIYFMENTGTKSEPIFSKLILEPFGLDSKDFSTPIFVDIDNDGDFDIFGLKGKMGGGKVYYIQNSGTKSEPIFSKPIFEPFGIDTKDLSTPKFVDIDGDGDLDVFGLKVKMGGGKVYYIENITN